MTANEEDVNMDVSYPFEPVPLQRTNAFVHNLQVEVLDFDYTDELNKYITTDIHLSIGLRTAEEVISELVELGADIDNTDIDNHTPLVYCVLNEKVECVKILLKLGADVHATNTDGEELIDIIIKNDVAISPEMFNVIKDVL